jgi:hypothetical protein
MDVLVRTQQIDHAQVTSHARPRHPMFRITRGITIDHAPAFPNPALRYPDGTPLPVYRDGKPAEESAFGDRAAEDQPPAEAPDPASTGED